MKPFRTPRNTTRAMREDPAEAMLALAVGMSDGTGESFILAQEAAGQREMVNSDVLPTDLRSPKQEFLDLGFTFGDQADGDPMFQHATLPAGWKREGSTHAMWSYLVDGDGFRRASIFYKAAFYDRSAHMSLDTVYGYVGTCLYEKKAPEPHGPWATREAVLDALASHRAQAAERVTRWTELGNAEYVSEYEEQVQLCDRFVAALTEDGAE